MVKTISIINYKGGTAKTTSTQNIAAALNLKGFKVLAIDLDPQANLTQSFGLNSANGKTISGAITNEYPLTPLHYKEGLDLIASNFTLEPTEIALGSEPGAEFILSEILKPIKDNYDYILIDCPPSLKLLPINALVASDYIIIPVEAHTFSVEGLLRIKDISIKIKKRLNKDLKTLGCFIVKYEKNIKLSQKIVEIIETDEIGINVFQTKIPKNITLAEASAMSKDIFSYDENSIGAKAYLDLTKEILNKIINHG